MLLELHSHHLLATILVTWMSVNYMEIQRIRLMTSWPRGLVASLDRDFPAAV